MVTNNSSCKNGGNVNTDTSGIIITSSVTVWC
jgi:hypothetical protein